jgi:hypothetical protein
LGMTRVIRAQCRITSDREVVNCTLKLRAALTRLVSAVLDSSSVAMSPCHPFAQYSVVR